MKSTDIPTTMEMGEKLDYLSRLLFLEQLIDYRSKSHLDKVSTQLKKRQIHFKMNTRYNRRIDLFDGIFHLEDLTVIF